jgi:hypothetical protein
MIDSQSTVVLGARLAVISRVIQGGRNEESII